jgi:hypothetical protein
MIRRRWKSPITWRRVCALCLTATPPISFRADGAQYVTCATCGSPFDPPCPLGDAAMGHAIDAAMAALPQLLGQRPMNPTGDVR